MKTANNAYNEILWDALRTSAKLNDIVIKESIRRGYGRNYSLMAKEMKKAYMKMLTDFYASK